jgi:isochorismate pyruvate lyase
MAREPEDCTTMDDLRAEIDRIDRELVRLLARRVACIDRAVELKAAVGLPARIGSRVEEVVAAVRTEADANGLDADAAEALWRMMIEWSIAREARVLERGGEP